MFIERGMHQKHKSPRGATGTICLNHGLKADSKQNKEGHAPAFSPRGAACL